MTTIADCLQLVRSAKASAQDPESAYVLRTRLKRSLLGVSQLTADYAGITGPLMPDDIDRMRRSENPIAAQILQVAVSLLAKTRKLCQPSEALDWRWRTAWPAVEDDLIRLELLLESLDRGDNGQSAIRMRSSIEERTALGS